jgi:hypothetical protein
MAIKPDPIALQLRWIRYNLSAASGSAAKLRARTKGIESMCGNDDNTQ